MVSYDRCMGAGHGHGSGHAGTRHRWRLALAFALVGAFFVVELVVGLWSGSLALLSDAGHMAADVVALGAALAATRIATRPDSTGRRTYGSYRAEVFASGFTVLVMLGAAAYVAIEAVRRTRHATSCPRPDSMLVVGGLGLLVNLVALVLLRGGAAESLAVKGAYVEVIADSLGSVGVMAAGLLVLITGQGWWDTAVALAIALFVAVRAVMLGREVLAVLGQHAPAGVDPDAVAADLRVDAGGGRRPRPPPLDAHLGHARRHRPPGRRSRRPRRGAGRGPDAAPRAATASTTPPSRSRRMPGPARSCPGSARAVARSGPADRRTCPAAGRADDPRTR